MAYFTDSRGDNNDGLRILNVRDTTGSGGGNWETSSYRIRRSIDQNDGSSGIQEEIIWGTNLLAFNVGGSERGRFTSAGLAISNTVAAAVAVASTHKVTIVIGGVTYYLLASNV
jgi:hypothetical protein